jgi:thiol-disulfide isomerase/thioredoxin
MTVVKVEVDLFKSKNCMWCIKLIPEWKKFEEMVNTNPKNSYIKVNVYEATDKDNRYGDRMAEKNYDFQGVPTIMINIEDGESIKYEQDRKAETILAFIEEKVAEFKKSQNGGKRKIHKKNMNATNINAINDAQYELKYYKYKAKYLKTKGE